MTRARAFLPVGKGDVDLHSRKNHLERADGGRPLKTSQRKKKEVIIITYFFMV
jgi:hypothetical protein